MSTFEADIREFTQPLNEQYPRPWMTKLTEPESAQVFIVGKNQAKGYRVDAVGSHDRYLDALFNRNGQSCRGLYDEITHSTPSPTRSNIDSLSRRLEAHGVTAILETNVICYSTPMSRDLGLPGHRGGRERGRELFRYLLNHIKPSVVIVHGADAARTLTRVIGTALPAVPERDDDIRITETRQGAIFVLPSLAPPAYNQWSIWAPGYLDRIAAAVARQFSTIQL